jgi:E3 ubiquitin-protein ligase UBR3
LKRNVGGCCDCGDPTAWAEDGFCSTHKGYSTETLLENLPEYIKSSAPLVFNALGKNLKFSCLEMQRAKELKLAL